MSGQNYKMPMDSYQKKESKYHFIYRIYKETKQRRIELLVLNTVNNNFIFYAVLAIFLKKVRIIMGVHDINSFFYPKPAMSIRGWVRYIGKICLIYKIKEFNVISLTMVSHLKNKIPAYKKIHCLPGGIFEESRLENEGPSLPDKIILVVPGTIDGRRRNYEIVFDLLEEASRMSLPLSIILLGSAYGYYGNSILKKCKMYAKTKSNLLYYESHIVDQSEFDRVLNIAHLVFIPCVIQTVIFDGIRETYGVSKCSGNIFDVVKHAKPFVIPLSLRVDPYLENSCIRYSNVQDIVSELCQLHRFPEKHLLLKKSVTCVEKLYY